MVETNARAMTNEFLRNSWLAAWERATEPTYHAESRATWSTIRDTYARELDRRDRMTERQQLESIAIAQGWMA
jgi:hypothetical protein